MNHPSIDSPHRARDYVNNPLRSAGLVFATVPDPMELAV
jgi:hypothetical protein